MKIVNYKSTVCSRALITVLSVCAPEVVKTFIYWIISFHNQFRVSGQKAESLIDDYVFLCSHWTINF